MFLISKSKKHDLGNIGKKRLHVSNSATHVEEWANQVKIEAILWLQKFFQHNTNLYDFVFANFRPNDNLDEIDF